MAKKRKRRLKKSVRRILLLIIVLLFAILSFNIVKGLIKPKDSQKESNIKNTTNVVEKEDDTKYRSEEHTSELQSHA